MSHRVGYARRQYFSAGYGVGCRKSPRGVFSRPGAHCRQTQQSDHRGVRPVSCWIDHLLATSRQFRDSIGLPQANTNPILSQQGSRQLILRPRVTNTSPTSTQRVEVGSSPTGGARFISTERNPTPVNARRREIGCRAFCVSGQFWQEFASIPPPASRSLFRERTFRVSD